MDFIFGKKLTHTDKDLRAHTAALLVAMLGPLINLLIGYPYSAPPPGMYLYWAVALLIYVAILIPFTYKSLPTLAKLVFLGIAVEDFFSNFWRSLFFKTSFLPFYNWYTQHFPFLGSLGEPTPYALIPQWYIAAIAIYFGITLFQYRKELGKMYGRNRKKV